MRQKPSRTFALIIMILSVTLVTALVIVLLMIGQKCCFTPVEITSSYIVTLNMGNQFGTITATQMPYPSSTPLEGVIQFSVSPQAPYEPTLYAERQAMLENFTTAAGPATYVQFYATETALVSAYQGTPTATVTPIQMPGYAFCTWSWSERSLPPITNLAQIALSMYREGDITVWVDAFGEDCLGENREVLYFGAMNTDFHVTVMLDSLTDEAAMAEIVTGIYQTLKAGLEEAWLPAPFGRLDITFEAGSEQRLIAARFSSLETLLERGLQGKALLDALGLFQ